MPGIHSRSQGRVRAVIHRDIRVLKDTRNGSEVPVSWQYILEAPPNLSQDNRRAVHLSQPGMHRTLLAEHVFRFTKYALLALVANCKSRSASSSHGRKLSHKCNDHNQLHATMLAWESMNCKYDFRAHTVSVYEMKVVVHDKPDKRASWSYHGSDGCYIKN